ncbi:CPBP family intramembrane glutamic endopeptidase [Desulfitobacterium sp. Sab5]|uniref:CPBP family intramembrane glutamic endopeptidase n=1 Tax=Desulfitobacterium nosdiversum TaxID=3375356 RepID=UPI003CEE2CCB
MNEIKKHIYLAQAALIIITIILSISLANAFSGIKFYIFYNLIYGLLLSTALPLYFAYKNCESINNFGIKKIGIQQIIVLVTFDIMSIGGQYIPLIINSTPLHFELIPICIVPLTMTTFFEEFLFRGFFQIRFEKQYGWLPAILLSGLLFSIYHLGYPGFRDLGDLLLLFIVGIGFAVAFKLSDNNVIISYFVNLPNAILTYLLKAKQFPPFDKFTTVIAGVTIIFFISFIVFYEKNKRRLYDK